MKWVAKYLGEILTFQRGFDITKKEQTFGKYPVISSSGINSYHNAFKCKAPGVITGRKGTLGQVFYINQDYWPHDTTLWVKDFKGNNPRFIYYFLKTLHFENFDAGASNPTLNRNHIHRLRVSFPTSLHIQQKIVSILSAYDKLIENNARRIAILEEMAQQIYKEWFVRMRFPGYRQAEFQEGVPVGWEEKKLSEFCNLTMGQSPKSEFYNQEGIGLPFHQGVTNFTNRFPIHITYCSIKKRIAQKGDILFSVRAPVGRINIADRELIVGRGLAAFNHKKRLNSFLFYLLQEAFHQEDLIGGGTIFNAVSKNELFNFKVLYPGKNLDKEFDELVSPIDKEIKVLFDKNINLRITRDLLLPRLISGKITV